jgi:hypothetical protein
MDGWVGELVDGMMHGCGNTLCVVWSRGVVTHVLTGWADEQIDRHVLLMEWRSGLIDG